MTQNELIQMALRGERLPRQEHSLHDARKDIECIHNGFWRCIVCDGDKDVCECSRCGEQRVMSCNFDDDYA